MTSTAVLEAPADDAPTTGLTTAALLNLGLTLREVDYWARRRYVRPVGGPHPGYGRNRRWTLAEVQVAKQMLQLRNLGFTLRAAALLARSAAARTEVIRELLTMPPPHPDAEVEAVTDAGH